MDEHKLQNSCAQYLIPQHVLASDLTVNIERHLTAKQQTRTKEAWMNPRCTAPEPTVQTVTLVYSIFTWVLVVVYTDTTCFHATHIIRASDCQLTAPVIIDYCYKCCCRVTIGYCRLLSIAFFVAHRFRLLKFRQCLEYGSTWYVFSLRITRVEPTCYHPGTAISTHQHNLDPFK